MTIWTKTFKFGFIAKSKKTCCHWFPLQFLIWHNSAFSSSFLFMRQEWLLDSYCSTKTISEPKASVNRRWMNWCVRYSYQFLCQALAGCFLWNQFGSTWVSLYGKMLYDIADVCSFITDTPPISTHLRQSRYSKFVLVCNRNSWY